MKTHAGSGAALDGLSLDLDREARHYLGLRAALGNATPASTLRSVARHCEERAHANQTAWSPDGPLPLLQVNVASGCAALLQRKTPAVMCTLHVGPYHRIPLQLMEMGVPLTMVVDAPNLARQQADFDRWYLRYQGSGLEPMRFVNAENATSVWEMAKAVRSGRSLFVYADGHTGFQRGSNPRNVIEISFCGIATRVRKGLAYVSAATEAPVVPVMAAFGSGGEHVLTFYEPIQRALDESSDAFCRRALVRIFALLEDFVARDAACWEEWCRFYEWIVPDQGLEASPSIAAASRDELSDTRLVLCADRVEVVVNNGVSALVNTYGGEGLALTPILKATAELLDGAHSVRQVVERLAHTYEADAVLEVVRQLAAGSFARTAG